MKTINIFRAQPLRDRGGEPTTITILDEIPDVVDLARRAGAAPEGAGALFADQGRELAQALYDSLPGGTFDALLAELLSRRASLLRVPFGPRP